MRPGRRSRGRCRRPRARPHSDSRTREAAPPGRPSGLPRTSTRTSRSRTNRPPGRASARPGSKPGIVGSSPVIRYGPAASSTACQVAWIGRSCVSAHRTRRSSVATRKCSRRSAAPPASGYQVARSRSTGRSDSSSSRRPHGCADTAARDPARGVGLDLLHVALPGMGAQHPPGHARATAPSVPQPGGSGTATENSGSFVHRLNPDATPGRRARAPRSRGGPPGAGSGRTGSGS